MHQSIFPEGYTWAGKLRTDMVKIISSANVSGRIIDPMISSVSIEVVRPENINSKLDLLINMQFKVILEGRVYFFMFAL